MEAVRNIPDRIAGGINSRYFLLAAAAAIPVFIMAHFYAHALDPRDDEIIASFITIYFFCGIFLGRYLSQLLILRYKPVPNNVLRMFSTLVVVCIIVLFFAAQFTLVITLLFVRLLIVGLPLLLLSISAGMLIKLVRTSIRDQLDEAKAAAAQSQSELKFLQSQLSPHFLFNTLNNIYGISLSQHEKVPGLLLKLSSLLRYSVYDVKELFVPLKSELDYINDYIDFEKIRVGNKLVLTTAFEQVAGSNCRIAPLLLIVFIENAFKHSKNTTEEKIYIDISLRSWGNSILFSIRNSNSGTADRKSVLYTDSGFGLSNVTKRLELLYGQGYSLEIEDKDGYYTVMLQLKAK